MSWLPGNRCRHELEAQGEKLDFRAFIPPPVSDEQNFAATPVFVHLFDRPPPGVPEDDRWVQPDARLRRVRVNLQAAPDKKAPRFLPVDSDSLIDLAQWQRFFAGNTNYPQPAAPQSAAQDVLLALSGFEVELTELEQAATRPQCRWPVDYTVANPIAVRLPHLARLRALAQVPLLRAAAHLEAGQSAKALADLKLILRLACALERSRLAHGRFPDTLEALVPRFLDKLPQDIVSGEPMKYRRTGDGGGVLYAVGWNAQDDGGESVRPTSRSKSPDPTQGDWVWTCPPGN